MEESGVLQAEDLSTSKQMLVGAGLVRDQPTSRSHINFHQRFVDEEESKAMDRQNSMTDEEIYDQDGG